MATHFSATVSWATTRRSATTIHPLSTRSALFLCPPDTVRPIKIIFQKNTRGTASVRSVCVAHEAASTQMGFDEKELRNLPTNSLLKDHTHPRNVMTQSASPFQKRTTSFASISKKALRTIPRCSGKDGSSSQGKTPFGFTRKDVLLIGLVVTLAGIGLKSGLEYFGVDPLQAGNVVQLVLVLGLTVGWISTYIFRVSNKEMTYAQQLRDYESKVMEKRLESLTEGEIEALLEQVEEEKRRLAGEEQVK